jgi:hypothetical protein
MVLLMYANKKLITVPQGNRGTAMTRGRKPVKAIGEAKRFAERMGYRWQDNPFWDLAYDFLIFKPASFRAVKVRQTRYRINPEPLYEELFPDEIRGLRDLPFPQFILKELWLRTQHERVWRRLVVYPVSIEELEWWMPDGYTNPHAR